MKARNLPTALRPGGILRWSTVCILAGSLAGCDRGVRHVVTEKDAEMANVQTQIEKIDSEKSKLVRGEVANNFHIPQLGYYHAEAREFYEQPYGFEEGGRYFINGRWEDYPIAATVAESRPTPETLKKVEKALEEEQKVAANSGNQGQQGSGFGMGNALMMYWLLAGNRGMFGGGNGFRQASTQAGNWQQGVDTQRSAVGRYAAANPGYQRMVDQSRASGSAIRPGQSVRGGFGTSRASTGSSIGS